MTSTITDASALRDLVHRFKICWELWPEQVLNKSRIEQVGYTLELLGTHAEGTEQATPGCDACLDVYGALRRIAGWLTPKNKTLPARFEVEAFEPALRYSSDREDRPDVVLEIKILHRSGLGPIDECERHCLGVMQDKLKLIGAHRRSYKSDPGSPDSEYRGDDYAKCH